MEEINMFNCPAPLTLSVRENYILRVCYNNGEVRDFDFKPYIERDKCFRSLKNEKLFKQAHIERWAVYWDDELDIAIEEVYEKGVTVNHVDVTSECQKIDDLYMGWARYTDGEDDEEDDEEEDSAIDTDNQK